jgi:hypothetical protein
MPLPTNNSRPSINAPYVPSLLLPNAQGFELLGTKRVFGFMLDGQLNWITDILNIQADAINKIQAGVIIGADNPINANKLVKTDGNGNLSWVLVANNSIDDGAINTRTLADQSVTTGKIALGAIGTQQLAVSAVNTVNIAESAVTNTKIAKKAINLLSISSTGQAGSMLVFDNGTGDLTTLGANAANFALMSTGNNTKPQFRQITGNDIANVSIPAGKYVAGSITSADIASNSVITSKISDKNVTAAKINSGNAALGLVLTADGVGGASFLLNKGKILQIQSVLFDKIDTNSGTPQANTYYSFRTYPLKLTITPQSTTSTILVYLNANFGGAGSSFFLYGGIFKNNQIWKFNEYQNFKRTFGSQVSNTLMANFSNMFLDTEHDLNSIDYELKFASSLGGNASVYLNTCGGIAYYLVSSMIAIEIDL